MGVHITENLWLNFLFSRIFFRLFLFILSITSPALALVVGEGAVVIGQTLVEGVVVVVVLIVGGYRGRFRKIVIVTETHQLFIERLVARSFVTVTNNISNF
jgi:hypothetical protein